MKRKNRLGSVAMVFGALALVSTVGIDTVLPNASLIASAQAASDHDDEHAEDGHAKEDSHGQEAKHGEEAGHGDEENHGHDERGGGHNEVEGALTLSEEQIRTAGIEIVSASARAITLSSSYPGEIRFNDDRTSHIVPQVSGFVEQVNANLGESVRKGQVLAVIASQEISQQRTELSAAQKRLELTRVTLGREKALWEEKISPEQDYLQARQAYQEAEIEVVNARQKVNAMTGSSNTTGGNRYELRAPFDGVIVEKHLGIGERVDSSTNAFMLSDLNQVWATFSVPPSELGKVTPGREVTVSAPDLQSQVQGKIGYVGSLLGEQNRAAQVRVTVTNPQGVWRPGLYVNVQVAAQQANAAVAIPQAALHTVEDQPTVFIRTGEGFQTRTVTTGRRDGSHVEVLTGLEPGEELAGAGSFILKSELGKASAEHSH